jgi:transcriptional regulator with XRE-family HTH domain
MRRCGTYAKYVIERCRCDACRAVCAMYHRRQYRQKHRLPFYVRRFGKGKVAVVSGRLDRQSHHRTRDFAEALRVCAEMNRAAEEAGAVSDPYWASPTLKGLVRKYLRQLRAAGVGQNRIAAVAGVARSRVAALLTGHSHKKDRPQRQRLKWSTAQRLLGVQVGDLAAGARVPAAETWRLIDEMVAAGMTKRAIASQIMGRDTLSLQLSKWQIQKRHATTVRRLYDLFADPRRRPTVVEKLRKKSCWATRPRVHPLRKAA